MVTSSPTVDEELGAASLVWALRGIQADDIVLTTIPWQLYPQNHNWVEWTPEADAVWAAVAADTPVVDALRPADPTGPAPGQTGQPAPAPSSPAPSLPDQTTSVADQQGTVCPS